MTPMPDTAPARTGFPITGLLDRIRDLLAALRTRKHSKRQLRNLYYLNKHMSRDIGFDPSDIRHNDPFASSRHLGHF